jgi:DNA-directed RNA polymerase specialized sigma24 family protein
MDLAVLAEYCALEMSKYRRRESYDDCYCLEVLRRALLLRSNDAFILLLNLFAPSVRLWLRRHPSREAALRHWDENSYVNDTFRRFWQSMSNQALEFASLASALQYLHLCLNSVVLDNLRTYARKELVALPDYDSPDDQPTEDTYHVNELWDIIESILNNPRELRVIYLLYHCGLKPREIIAHCPGEFVSEQEIYRLTRNSLDRLKRNSDKIRWKFGYEG